MRTLRPLGPKDFDRFCRKIFPDLAAYFYAVDAGNRQDAALKLEISPQRVGQRLQALEGELSEFLNQGNLIKRDKQRHVVPTEAGLSLCQFTRDVINRYEAFLGELHRLQHGTEVKVASIHAAWMTYGPQLEAAYKKQVPDGSVTIQFIGGPNYPAKVLDEIVQGRFDIGITSYPPKIYSPFVLQPLKKQELRLVFNSTYLKLPKTKTVSLDRVMLNDFELKLVLHARGTDTPLGNRVRAYAHRSRVDFSLTDTLDAKNIAEIINTVEQLPNTASILPKDAIDSAVKAGRLVSYSLNPPMEPWTWGVIYRSSTSRPAIKMFLECLRPLFDGPHKSLNPS